MSRKTALQADIVRALINGRGKGSSRTRAFGEAWARRFAEWTKSANIQILGVKGIRQRTVQTYIADRKAAGASHRTLQNEMSYMRVALRGAGRAEFAGSQEISNSALGLASARNPGHIEMSTERYTAARAAMEAKDKGFAAALDLQYFCGLRTLESTAHDAEELTLMARTCAERGEFPVTKGTKGKKPRMTQLPSAMRADAQRALEQAAALAKSRGGFLIAASDREKAAKKFQNASRRKGELTGVESAHSARYRAARKIYEGWRGEDLSVEKALARTAVALGHGDGRGRYVRRVYLRGKINN